MPAGFSDLETRRLIRGDAVSVGYSVEEQAVIIVVRVGGALCGVGLTTSDANALAADVHVASEAVAAVAVGARN